MKVIHIESGLGNQMLSYCEYLAMRKANPQDKLYIETIIYDIPECNQVTCQWNGYELDRIFNIQASNIKEIITPQAWEKLISEIRESKFWEKNMNYPVYFTRAFKNIEINLVNTFGDFEEPQFWTDQLKSHDLKLRVKKILKYTLIYCYLRMWKARRKVQPGKLDCTHILFPTTKQPLFAGQKLLFKYKGSGIELIEKEIRESFTFPEITDEKNLCALKQITGTNSVAIHARRGDMLGTNYACYVTGYFKRAVKLIRKNVQNPTFYIFCDPGSVQWAKENFDILGLNGTKDHITFVDWNKGNESFRDMQLMAQCKHQIITNSSFGWWGAWLNDNPDKITCSPDYRINTTHTI